MCLKQISRYTSPLKWIYQKYQILRISTCTQQNSTNKTKSFLWNNTATYSALIRNHSVSVWTGTRDRIRTWLITTAFDSGFRCLFMYLNTYIIPEFRYLWIKNVKQTNRLEAFIQMIWILFRLISTFLWHVVYLFGSA